MKITLKKELKVSKETISKLQENQMAAIRGGNSAVLSSSGPKCTCKNTVTCGSDEPVEA